MIRGSIGTQCGGEIGMEGWVAVLQISSRVVAVTCHLHFQLPEHAQGWCASLVTLGYNTSWDVRARRQPAEVLGAHADGKSAVVLG
jgi:hypothetical protein